MIDGEGELKFKIGANDTIIDSKEINMKIEKFENVNEKKFYLSKGFVENTAINSCINDLTINLTNNFDNSETVLITEQNSLKLVKNLKKNKFQKVGGVFMRKDGISFVYIKNSNTDELIKSYELKKNYFIEHVPFDYKWCNVYLCKNNDGVVIKNNFDKNQFWINVKNSNSNPNFIIFPNNCLLFKYTVIDEPISDQCNEIVFC